MVTHTAIVDDVIANHTMNVINHFQITSYVVFGVYKYSFSVFESPQHSGGIHDQELLVMFQLMPDCKSIILSCSGTMWNSWLCTRACLYSFIVVL